MTATIFVEVRDTVQVLPPIEYVSAPRTLTHRISEAKYTYVRNLNNGEEIFVATGHGLIPKNCPEWDALEERLKREAVRLSHTVNTLNNNVYVD